ncbi:hypothetical protein PHYSODRAFT_332309 [Phytophthora sojae]|uniref:Uncharacterized protein n=1 Tax=Phytophthora sojae (strain P6497) TaxID=1094619 RepID=G4ZFS3_PHYSP|nr:hypothetical protein PHYSODRAFT_332309 [Phytophthora sojae]EGZ18541.1 hypothetical protein PHYSODRAFT_332309 [Phytophthora sojae]|eukprot:XP_009527599.1 hypothetical protein PHYSODRAFT_332309 [Phytophthora sojae]
MPRNRVGIEVDSLPPAHKQEDEPHIDSSRDLLGGSFSSTQLKSTASAPSLEAAKAQRQKELLRKKKTERRAHAQQRAAEKQQRQDEKKQEREMLSMMDEDFPAVDPPNVLVDTSTSTQSLACLEVERKDEEAAAMNHDAVTFVSEKDPVNSSSPRAAKDDAPLPPLSYGYDILADACPPTTTETMPKVTKGSPLAKNANAAAATIQKALKKKFKKCKTMFRQSPRVFAEEVVVAPSSPEETATEVPATCDDGALETELVGPTVEALGVDIVRIPDSPHEKTPSSPRPEPIVPLLTLPLKAPGTPPPLWFRVFVLFLLVFIELNFKSKLISV